MPNGHKGKRRRNQTARLRERDGDNCYYCHKPMSFGPTMVAQSVASWQRCGTRVSIEHIIDRKYGGNSRKENLVLAHNNCNSSRAGLYTAEKALTVGMNLTQLAAFRKTLSKRQIKSKHVRVREDKGHTRSDAVFEWRALPVHLPKQDCYEWFDPWPLMRYWFWFDKLGKKIETT